MYKTKLCLTVVSLAKVLHYHQIDTHIFIFDLSTFFRNKDKKLKSLEINKNNRLLINKMWIKCLVAYHRLVSPKAQILGQTGPDLSHEYGTGSEPGDLFSWRSPVSVQGLFSQLLPLLPFQGSKAY